MSPFLQIECNHISNFEYPNLIGFTDSWCESIIDEKRKKESLLARFLLNKICENHGLESIFKCGFQKDKHGKPFFLMCPSLHISITHCDGYVWVAIANSPLGIDFEKINNEAKEDLKIAFDLADWNVVAHDANLVFKYFSLKEAYSKMIGTGFATEPSEIKIDLLHHYHTEFLSDEKNNYVFSLITLNLVPTYLLNLDFKNILSK